MAGRIPQTFIDDLISRSDIVEIINARIPLKKKGKEYSACCPFHNEKTPSFTVSETKQFYHCFGCGAHGTVIGFLMEYENLDFIEAIEALASEYNLDVPRENTKDEGNQPKDDRPALYEVLEQACLLFQEQLKGSSRAIDYLKQRGISGETAKKYRLGYAPDDWNFLSSDPNNRKLAIEQLVTVGLLIKKDNGNFYDRFRDRIMFPIIDPRGRVIGFGGRIIDKGEPKYLNSPESVLFHKGLELYGLREAKQSSRNLKRILIVEGYMDVVALAQHGVNYAIACLGTATTKEQIQKALRSTSEIIFCYDGDSAGIKAAWRAVENTLPIIRDGQVAKFLILPEKEDPDSMIRQEGKKLFEERLANATPLSDYLFDTLKQKTEITSEDGKARFFEMARPLISSMNDSLFKDLLTDKLSGLIGITAERLGNRLPQKSQPSPTATNKYHIEKNKRQHSTTRKAIALLLQNPSLAKQHPVPDDFANTTIQGLPLLHQIHRHAADNPGIATAALLERFRDTPEEAIVNKLVELDIPGTDDFQQTSALYADYIKVMKSRLYEAPLAARQSELEAKFNKGKLSSEEKQEYLSLISGKTGST